MQDFKDIAEQQGWTLKTQVEVLLEYIENQQSDEAFNDFISEKTDGSTDTQHLGLSEALENLSYGKVRQLYKCSVGVYPTVDAEHPIKEYEAFVAEKDVNDAMAESVHLCEQEYGEIHQGLSFATEGEPVVVDPETLQEVE